MHEYWYHEDIFYISYLSGNFLTFLWCRHGRCSPFHCHCSQHNVCRHSVYRQDRVACDWRWFQTSGSIGHTPPHSAWFSLQSPQFFPLPLLNIPLFCWNEVWTNEFLFYIDYWCFRNQKVVKNMLVNSYSRIAKKYINNLVSLVFCYVEIKHLGSSFRRYWQNGSAWNELGCF